MKTLIDIAYKRHGITTQKLADALGMSVRNVGRIGNEVKLTATLARKIMRFFKEERGVIVRPEEYSEEWANLYEEWMNT